MASSRVPGVHCRFRLFPEIDIGTLCRQTSPAPGPLNRFSVWPELHDPGFLPAAFGLAEAISEADQAEFAIIKTMPVMSRKKRAYGTVNQYVSDRTIYFGSPSAYATFAAESDTELANTKWVGKKRTRSLRSMIEFDKTHQARQQQIFYRWVRKAYKRKYGDDADVPELIRKGMSKELEEQLAAVRSSVRVKEAHAEEFKAGGFNPRPVKQPKPGRKGTGANYILGTLSDHATGMAVDVDDKRNPQLSLKEWAFIEKLVGKSITRSGRWKTEADAEGLWNDFKSLNDLFVEKVVADVKRIEKERAEKEKTSGGDKGNAAHAVTKPATSPVKVPKPKAPLEDVLGDHFKSLAKWVTTGFFHLPLDLVLELHAHGFKWGATFASNVDLHHFELEE